MAVHRAAAVGHGSPSGVPALDDTLIAVALGDAGHVYLVAGGEGIGLDHVAHVQVRSGVQLKLLQVLFELYAGFLQVAGLGLGQLGLLRILKAQLHGNVTVLFQGFLLGHDTGAGSMTVTGMTLPLSSKIWVMPTFLPMIAFMYVPP